MRLIQDTILKIAISSQESHLAYSESSKYVVVFVQIPELLEAPFPLPGHFGGAVPTTGTKLKHIEQGGKWIQDLRGNWIGNP